MSRVFNLKSKKERGSILAVSTFGMLAFLLAVGLSVDIGHMYLVKTELQNAVDASALAGASALNSNAAGITTATDRAVKQMNSYEFNKTGLKIPRANVTFSNNFEGPYISEDAAKTSPNNIRFIKVKTPDSAVKMFFASIVLGGSKNVVAEATGGLSVPINVFCDWIPLSVIDDNVATIVPGQTYVIRSKDPHDLSPGNYQVLAVAGTGGSNAREGIARGVNSCDGPGAVYQVDTEPGVNSGPVRQGINTRFDEYAAGMDPAQFPPDTNIAEDITYEQYINNQVTKAPSHPGVPGRRVVIIPIVKKSEYNNGRDEVKFNRFAAFFLRRKVGGGNGGEIEAEYIGERFGVGRGGYDPNGGTANNLLAIPVLYK
jgi:hypothetical protein